MIKTMLRRYVDRIARRAVRANVDALNAVSQQVQLGLVLEYRNALRHGRKSFSNIRDAGFRVYSQFEEDGIILYLLALIGFGNRRVVEICAGDGMECMATNLILNHGFEGFL